LRIISRGHCRNDTYGGMTMRLVRLLAFFVVATLMGISECATDGDGDGWTVEDGDCDDSNPSRHPGAFEVCGDLLDMDCDGKDGAAEVCDGKDNDCNGYADEANSNSPQWWPDLDKDMYGDASEGFTYSCTYPNTSFAWSARGGDCNDQNADINPEAPEIPNDGIDQDCDGVDAVDADADGYTVEDGDCDDTIWYINPGVSSDSICDGDDNDCDGLIDEDINPDAIEYCNGIDDNCNGQVDDYTIYGDGEGKLCSDGDGDGYTEMQGDCDDADPATYPGHGC